MMPPSAASAASSIITSPAPAESVFQTPCAICRRQFSRYTCARCNTPYCSLPCFRSQGHAACSETFYRAELESDVRAAPGKTQEERVRMMELLKRFEEEDRDSGTLEDEENEDEDNAADDLLRRLEGVSLESANETDIWELLTQAERARFSKALQDPQSDLAQQLLASDVPDRDLVEPWWADLAEGSGELETRRPTSSTIMPARTKARPTGAVPQAMDIPHTLLRGASLEAASRIIHNICALCMAYSHVTRRLSASPLASIRDDADVTEARRMIGEIVPFLVDRRSKVVFEDLEIVITDVYARLEPNVITPGLLALLMDDAATLLRPAIVAEFDGPTSNPASAHACTNLLRVLSDLRALFARTTSPERDNVQANRETATTHKLLFYAAQATAVPAPIWKALSHSLRRRAIQEREVNDR